MAYRLGIPGRFSRNQPRGPRTKPESSGRSHGACSNCGDVVMWILSDRGRHTPAEGVELDHKSGQVINREGHTMGDGGFGFRVHACLRGPKPPEVKANLEVPIEKALAVAEFAGRFSFGEATLILNSLQQIADVIAHSGMGDAKLSEVLSVAERGKQIKREAREQ